MGFLSRLTRRKAPSSTPKASSTQAVLASGGTVDLATQESPQDLRSDREQQFAPTGIRNEPYATKHNVQFFDHLEIGGQSRSHVGNVYAQNVTNNYGPMRRHVAGEEDGRPHETVPSADELRREAEGQLTKERRTAEDVMFEEEQRLAFLRALGFDAMGIRLVTISPAHAETCKWFVETPEYQRWRDESRRNLHHGVLWITGNPGAGKSTLMKYALQVAERDTDNNVISFFFNARGHTLEKSTAGMYRSLLSQLLIKLPRLFSSRNCLKQDAWPIESLANMFRATVLSMNPTERVTCYIDALDECNEDEVRNAIAHFEDIGELALAMDIQFSICFASRHYPRITMYSHEELKLDDRSDHMQDISRYVKSNLDRVKLSDPLREKIRTNILSRYSGVFFWVVLIIKIVKEKYDGGASSADMFDALRAVPSGLQNLFASVIEHPDEDMVAAFQWVLYAKIQLRPEGLYLAIKTSSAQLSTGVWDEAEVDWESIERFIIRSSRGLIELVDAEDRDLSRYRGGRRPRRYVQFIHESVREHLLNGALANLTMKDHRHFEASTQAQLTQWCLLYMRLDSARLLRYFDEPDPLSQQIQRVHKLSLAFYISENIFHHAEFAYKAGALPLEFLMNFPIELLVCFHNYGLPQLPKYEEATDLFYMLICHRCFVLAKAFLASCSKTDRPGIPSYVSVGKSVTFDINRLWQTGIRHGESRSDLIIAASSADIELVQLLLDYGADAELFGCLSGSPLIASVRKGHMDITKLLLHHGAKVNCHDCDGRNALEAAAFEGAFDLVKLLLAHNAGVNLTGGDHGSVLGAAIVGRDARWKATKRDYDGVVHLLLDHGAQVNTWRDWSPLWLAAAQFDCETVRQLLDHGADIDARDQTRSWTPLQMVAANCLVGDHFASGSMTRQEVMMTTLLEAGANVNAVHEPYGTLLIAVTANDQFNVVRILLAHGADLQHRGPQGTALDVALDRAHTVVARQLWDATFPESTLARLTLDRSPRFRSIYGAWSECCRRKPRWRVSTGSDVSYRSSHNSNSSNDSLDSYGSEDSDMTSRTKWPTFGNRDVHRHAKQN